MERITEKRAEKLLKKYSKNSFAYRKVLQHVRAVRRLALKIASKSKRRLDKKFISTASLLHDIGRFDNPPGSKRNAVWHGVAGARILRKEGLPRHARAAERHVGSGITKAEAKKLGLPAKSYLPRTAEEKIICYADSLIFGDKEGTLKKLLERYRKEVGPQLVKRTIKLHDEIERMKNG
ncbi:HDIG domain-containing protein [Candidatus Woesearchaeota archaeon]|nr:HDIG domain-containing protein [Candidatus Woesearchaeota archaeon]